MKWCKYCQRQVQPRKHINWFILILMCFLTGGLWLLIYVPYYLLFKGSSCPICGGDV